MTPIFAQFQAPSPIPINGGTVDLTSYVTQALSALVAPASNLFLGQAFTLFNRLALLALVLGAMTWTWEYLTGNHIFSGEHFWRVMVRVLIGYNLLRYFNTPLPLVGYSFHQVFTEEGRWLSSQIDISTMNLFINNLGQMWGGMEKPHFMDLPATVIYAFVGVDMFIMQAALFVVTAFAFWALAVGIVLGPFFIVAYLFRSTQHFFWAWVSYMIKYSLYKVVASCIVFVFCTIMLSYINNAFGLSIAHADLSIGHFWAILPAFVTISAFGVFACFKVGAIVNDLTSGSAFAGSGMPIPILRRFV